MDPEQALDLQRELAPLVEREDRLAADVRLVAGVDVAYEVDGPRVFAAVVVIDVASRQTVETAMHTATVNFPYVPGMFSFRELPALCPALEQIRSTPDLIICDGQGVAHPERFGLACHLGVLFDVPVIGCGKSRLTGEFTVPDTARGSVSPLTEAGEDIGCVLRTQDGVKPLFVSVGHRVSLITACDWVLSFADEFRQPEPIRRADHLANEARARQTGSN